MKFLFGRTIVSFLFLLMSCSPFLSAHTDLTTTEVWDRIQLGGDLIILDVRDDDEFCSAIEHIEDAVNMSWRDNIVQTRFNELPTDWDIIVVCAAGGRSNSAANFLDGNGFTSVFDMVGGMGAWTYDVEPCLTDPLLLAYRNMAGVVILNWIPSWTATTPLQDYYLIRGLQDNVVEAPPEINLGATDCLARQTAFTYLGDTDASVPGQVIFYLVKQEGGAWGQSSAGLDRMTPTPDCN
ncbi:rhodanese-like domain-containing protein [Acidobacteriota bacterium]